MFGYGDPRPLGGRYGGTTPAPTTCGPSGHHGWTSATPPCVLPLRSCHFRSGTTLWYGPLTFVVPPFSLSPADVCPFPIVSLPLWYHIVARTPDVRGSPSFPFTCGRVSLPCCQIFSLCIVHGSVVVPSFLSRQLQCVPSLLPVASSH